MGQGLVFDTSDNHVILGIVLGIWDNKMGQSLVFDTPDNHMILGMVRGTLHNHVVYSMVHTTQRIWMDKKNISKWYMGWYLTHMR